MPFIRELRTLNTGQAFAVAGLEEAFRNLRVKSISEGFVLIKGDEALDDFTGTGELKVRNWRTMQDHMMSPRTEVIAL